MLKYEETKHPYYCEADTYNRYDSWEEFKYDWRLERIDHDLNCIFRYDMYKDSDGIMILQLIYILQRKGIMVCNLVKNIQEEDMEDINKYLKECYEYHKILWAEMK